MMDRLISKLGIRFRSRSWGGPSENSTIADSYNVVEEVAKELKSAGLKSSRLILGFDFTESNDSTATGQLMMDRLISKLRFRSQKLSRSRSPGGASERLTIADHYNALEEVTKELKSAGVKSSRLMVCFDFTESNDSTGTKSFNKKSLHHIGHVQNPYQQTAAIVGKTLDSFDEENLIPCLAFGDAEHGQDNFSEWQESVCKGFEEVLNLYKEFVINRKLQGRISLAPIIGKAVTILESGGKHHVLLIITNGQILLHDNNVLEKTKITDAIVNASKFPLSIVLVGVGDGPWDMVKEFVGSIPTTRVFDNLHFVSFTDIMTKNVPPAQKVAEFARAALIKIPSQYNVTRKLFGCQNGNVPQRDPLPHYGYSSSVTTGTPATVPTYPNQVCCVCFINSKDLAFGCGHQICSVCYAQDICRCPICRDTILIAVKLKQEHDQWCPTCPPNRSNLKDMAFHCGHLTCSECGEYLDSCPTCGKTQKKMKLYYQ